MGAQLEIQGGVSLANVLARNHPREEPVRKDKAYVTLAGCWKIWLAQSLKGDALKEEVCGAYWLGAIECVGFRSVCCVGVEGRGCFGVAKVLAKPVQWRPKVPYVSQVPRRDQVTTTEGVWMEGY